MQSKHIKILVADDHTLFRQGIIRLLKDYENIIVVGEAEDGQTLINRYFEVNPDLIIVDIAMPGTSGIDAVGKILEKDPEAKALFLSMYSGDDYIYKVLKTGGKGLVNKNIMDGELFFAINKVFSGELYFSGRWTKEKLQELINEYESFTTASPNSGDEAALNYREEQILRLIALGMKSTEIAENLQISKKSVDHYRGTLIKKLGVKTQAELIKYGINYFTDK